ncbi:MAG: hypothetical protein BWY73_00963 [candidate division TA06 bacterium ADurb.Bin417]|uniref:Uncharacterized protein n=1 Tax=candidate division TA06 bacterium ADurb.Bin417 TaxID=1852828 RepID=A0A1V5MFG0_UNCT6|nr:MAG: hypothetical protein BWY73_00963 [candidate division TA06 bacterium ADurb.Bin417]
MLAQGIAAFQSGLDINPSQLGKLFFHEVELFLG